MQDDTCLICCCNTAEGDFSSGRSNARDTTTSSSSSKRWTTEEAWEMHRCCTLNDLSTSSSNSGEPSSISSEEEEDYPDACGEELWSLWFIAHLAFAALKSLTARSSEARMQRRTDARKQELLAIVGASYPSPAANCSPLPAQQLASSPTTAAALLPVSVSASRSSLVYSAVVALLRSVWRRDRQITIAAAALARRGSTSRAPAAFSASAADLACISSAPVPASSAASAVAYTPSASCACPLAAAAAVSSDATGASTAGPAAAEDFSPKQRMRMFGEDVQASGETRAGIPRVSTAYSLCAHAAGKSRKKFRFFVQSGTRPSTDDTDEDAAAAVPPPTSASTAADAGRVVLSVSHSELAACPAPLSASAALAAATPRCYVRLIYEGWLLKESKWRKQWRPRYVLLLSVEHRGSSNSVKRRVSHQFNKRGEQDRQKQWHHKQTQIQRQQQHLAAQQRKEPESHVQQLLHSQQQELPHHTQCEDPGVSREEKCGHYLSTCDTRQTATTERNVTNTSAAQCRCCCRSVMPRWKSRSWSREHAFLSRVDTRQLDDLNAEAAWQYEHDGAVTATGIAPSALAEEAALFVQTGQRKSSDNHSRATSASTHLPSRDSSSDGNRCDSSTSTTTTEHTVLLVTYDHNPRFRLRWGSSSCRSGSCSCSNGSCSSSSGSKAAFCSGCYRCSGHQEDSRTPTGDVTLNGDAATAAAVFPREDSPCSSKATEGNEEKEQQDAPRVWQENQQQTFCGGCCGGGDCAWAAAGSKCGADFLPDMAHATTAAGGCCDCGIEGNGKLLQLLRRAAPPTEVLQLSAENVRLSWMHISLRQLDMQLPLHTYENDTNSSSISGRSCNCRTPSPSSAAAAAGVAARAAAELHNDVEREKQRSPCCSNLSTLCPLLHLSGRKRCSSNSCCNSALLEDSCSSGCGCTCAVNEANEWMLKTHSCSEVGTAAAGGEALRGRGKLCENQAPWLTLAVRDKTTRRRVRFASSLMVGEATGSAVDCSICRTCAAAKTMSCESVSHHSVWPPCCAAGDSEAPAAAAEAPRGGAADAAGAGFVAAAAAVVSRLKHPVHLRQHFDCTSLPQCCCHQEPACDISSTQCSCMPHPCCCCSCVLSSSSSSGCCYCWRRRTRKKRKGRFLRSCCCCCKGTANSCHCILSSRYCCVCYCCVSLCNAERCGSSRLHWQQPQGGRSNVGSGGRSRSSPARGQTTEKNSYFELPQFSSFSYADEDENYRKGSLCSSVSCCSTGSGDRSNSSGTGSNRSSGQTSSNLSGSRDSYTSNNSVGYARCCVSHNSSNGSNDRCWGGGHADGPLNTYHRESHENRISCDSNDIYVNPSEEWGQECDSCCCCCRRSEQECRCVAAVGATEDLQLWCAKINDLLSANAGSSLGGSSKDNGCYLCCSSSSNDSSCSSCRGDDGDNKRLLVAGICESLPRSNPLHMFLSRASVVALAAAAACTSSALPAARGSAAFTRRKTKSSSSSSGTFTVGSHRTWSWSSRNARWSLRTGGGHNSKFHLPEILLHSRRSCNSSRLPRLSPAVGCCCYCPAFRCKNQSSDSRSSCGNTSYSGDSSRNSTSGNRCRISRDSNSSSSCLTKRMMTLCNVASDTGENNSSSPWKYSRNEGTQDSRKDQNRSSCTAWRLGAFSDKIYRMLLEQQKLCAVVQQQGPWICELQQQQQQHSSIALLSSSGCIMPRVQSWLQAAAREKKLHCMALLHHRESSSFMCHSGNSAAHHDNNNSHRRRSRSSNGDTTWLVPLMCRLPSSCWLRKKNSPTPWEQLPCELQQSQQKRFTRLQRGMQEEHQEIMQLRQQHQQGISQQLLRYEQELLRTFQLHAAGDRCSGNKPSSTWLLN